MGWHWWSREKEPPSALKIRDINVSSFLRGIKSGSSKNKTLRKFGPDLEISGSVCVRSRSFVSGWFCISESRLFFKSLSWILKPGSCSLTKSQIYNSVPLFLHWWGTKKYTTLPLTIKIPLTVRFQTQQLGFTPQTPTFLNSNSIRNARTFSTWAPGSGDWATTPHPNELK